MPKAASDSIVKLADDRRDALLDILDICTGWCRNMSEAEALVEIRKIAEKAI
jgi:hypothetical protein